jgi:hypothetical protein
LSDYKKWKCNHFSISLPEKRLPTLLRRVAKRIDVIKPEFVFDIVVTSDGSDMNATVYYVLPRRARRSSPAKKTT